MEPHSDHKTDHGAVTLSPSQIVVEKAIPDDLRDILERIIRLEVTMEHLTPREELERIRADMVKMAKDQIEENAVRFDAMNGKLDSMKTILTTTCITVGLCALGIFVAILVEIPWGDLIWIMMKNSSR